MPATHKFSLQIFAGLLLLAAIAPPATAQSSGGGGGIGNTTSTPVAGVPHDYITGLHEIVNPANGALSIRIPQPAPTERGQNWPAYAFNYESNRVFQLQPVWFSIPDPAFTYLGQLNYNFAAPGGSPSPGRVYSTLNTLTACVASGQYGCTTWTCDLYSGYIFTDPNGGQHGLGLQLAVSVTHNSAYDCGYFGASSYYFGGDEQYKASMDQSGNVTVVDSHGTRPMTEDANGNYHDTTHRTAPLPAPATIQTENVPVSQTYKVLNNSQDGGACGETSIPGPTSITATKSVTLPNGQQYSFQYDPVFGLVSKITYPTGATVTYTWSVIPNAEGVQYHTIVNNPGGTCSLQHDWFAITKRVLSYDGVTNAQEQDFSYSTAWPNPQSYLWTSKTTTVTTKDLIRGTSFNTVYNYLPALPPAESDKAFEVLGYVPVENTIQYYDTNGSLLKTITKSWATINEMSAECETLPNGQISGKFYSYQPYSAFNGISPQPFNFNTFTTDLPTDVAEYDYGQVATACVQPGSSVLPIRETVTAYQSFPSSPLFSYTALLDRPSSVKTYGVVGGNKTLLGETDYTYDGASPSAVTPTPYGHDETNFGFGSSAPRGNPTSVTRKCFVGTANCTNSVTNYSYDTTGQVLSVTDPNLNTTNYSYTDNYTTDDGSPTANTNAYVTTITRPATNGVSHITKFQYGFEDGKLRKVTDENSLVTTFCYWTGGCSGTTFDAFVRLTGSSAPDGGQATYTYNDTAITVTTSKSINPNQTMTTVALYDGLGHAKQTQLTSDPQGTVYTDTTFDGLGHVWKQSNPYRSGTDPTTSQGTTTYFYDALDRKCLEVPPDGTLPSGAACPSTQPANDLFTTYSNNTTTVTDQTNKSRKSVTDSLGRLTQVFEDPAGLNYETDYSYDALGNLLTVNQKGGTTDTTKWRTRTFTFDSLSRLLTSNNPEVGTITYKYDSDTNCASPNSFIGLLVSKTDARGIRTCAQYDALNRETVLNYSNGDPTVTTAYDQSACLTLSACQNIGHRTSMIDAAGSEGWAYQTDAANHRSAHADQRTTNSSPNNITNPSTYYFDFAGNVTQAVYPTGRVVNYTFDAANRPSTAADGSNGITYAAGPDTSPGGTCSADVTCYTPQGTFYALSIGETASFTGLNLTHTYNNRLQPLEFKASSTGGNAMDISYNFNLGIGDNGRVFGIANNIDNTRSQSFAYDALNRITSALTASTYATSPTHCWGETYTLDAWANLQSIAATSNSNYTGCTQESGFSHAADGNNHLAGFTYDAAGNTSSDTVYPNYVWDGESQLKSVNGTSYAYDGDGRRVAKVGSKLYWYGSGGEILAETTASGATTAEYIFFGGKRIAMLPAGSTPIYYIEDLLGTSRVITTNTGVVCYDADFYPYGGERSYTNTCSQNYKFEGKERDTETGNDDFGARYYSNRFGRWLSADWSAVPAPVPYANLSNPQTLNLYAMVADDPESFADLDGHTCDDKTGKGCFWQKVKNYFKYSEFTTDKNLAAALKKHPQKTENAKRYIMSQTNITREQLDLMSDKRVLDLATRVKLEEAEGMSSSAGAFLVPMLDATGKVHGELPSRVPDNWNREDMEEAAQNLRESIKNRKEELLKLGEEGAHRARIGEEERLLRQLEKQLSGS